MGIIKERLKPLLFYGGFPLAKITWRRVTGQQRIFILMYHRINQHVPPFFEVVVKPDFFERQIRFLKKHYEIVDLNDINRLEFIRASKRDIVVLTFDDGYRNNYTHAFPILKKYDVPATIFLATDYIDTNQLLYYDKLAWILYKTVSTPDIATLVKYDIAPEISGEIERFFNSTSSARFNILRSLAARLKMFPSKNREDILDRLAKVCKIKIWPGDGERAMLSWKEVKEMSEHGISFGSHTKSHPVLSSISASEAQKEIVESKRAIEEKIQKPVTIFAYPYGKKESYTDNIIKILINEGFKYACSSNVGAEQYPLKAPLMLKRKGVAPSPFLFF
jgi:peptidoglycan/xylan/chitin deacetylase (PgdA/CDA1 family)